MPRKTDRDPLAGLAVDPHSVSGMLAAIIRRMAHERMEMLARIADLERRLAEKDRTS
jgi:hypothetical protein